MEKLWGDHFLEGPNVYKCFKSMARFKLSIGVKKIQGGWEFAPLDYGPGLPCCQLGATKFKPGLEPPLRFNKSDLTVSDFSLTL